MHIEFPDDGGVLIVGDEEELNALANTISEAVETGESVGMILTGDGVESVTVRRLLDEVAA